MVLRLSENFRALFYAPFYATQATGACMREGLGIDLVASPSPADAARMLMAGEVDVMWGGPLRVLMTHEADPASDLVCFGNVVERDPFFLIGRFPRPEFALDDLQNVRLGVVSEVPTPWICLQDDLRRAGIDPGSLKLGAPATMAANADALRRGELDCVQLFQPYAEQLLSDNAGHVWYAAADRGLTAYTTLVARRSVLAERRSEFDALLRALSHTLTWFAREPVEDIAALLATYFPDTTRPIFAACIDRYRALRLWGHDVAIPQPGFDRLRSAMLSSGILKRGATYADCVWDPARFA